MSEYDEDTLRLSDPCDNCGLPFCECDCPDEPDYTCRICHGGGYSERPGEPECAACNGTGEERFYLDDDEDDR